MKWKRRWHRRQRRHWTCEGYGWDGKLMTFDAREVGARDMDWVRDWRRRHETLKGDRARRGTT